MFIENIHRVFGVFLIRPRIGLSFIIFHTSNSNCLESETFMVLNSIVITILIMIEGNNTPIIINKLEIILHLLSFQKIMLDKMILSRFTLMDKSFLSLDKNYHVSNGFCDILSFQATCRRYHKKH